jgi:hypothetical protein
VETLRRQLERPTSEALSVYLDRLPAPLYKEVEITRRIRRMGRLTWEQIVEIANDTVAMGTEDITIDGQPAKPQRSMHQPKPPPARITAPPTTAATTTQGTGGLASANTTPRVSSTTGAVASVSNERVSGGCWICDDMGVPGPHRHSPEICFCNPQARQFRRDVYDRRVQKMKRDGRNVTDRLLTLGDPPADAK